MTRRAAVLIALLVGPACGEFSTPAELTKPTVLAVIAEPPLVAPGATTELEVVVAGPGGLVEPSETRWTLTETFSGVPPFGELTAVGARSAIYRAPDPVPELPRDVPPLVGVEVTVVADDLEIVVIKALLVADLPSANPSITAVAIGGAVVGDTATIRAGDVVELDVGVEPAPGDDATFAWYSTVGEIARYQSNPTELIAADAARDGWLFVVVRDGRGGVAWRGVEVAVE
jgi:hypothetical protein